MVKITITKGKRKGTSTINIRTGKGTTTINIRTGKGEDLRGIVELLAGQKMDGTPLEGKDAKDDHN